MPVPRTAATNRRPNRSIDSSRACELAATSLGISPGTVQSNQANRTIHFCASPSPLGTLLLARTSRGLCAVALGDQPEPLIADLRRRFRAANLLEDPTLAPQIASIVATAHENPAALLHLPLDLHATAFQMRVWEALRRIPAGQTRTYAEVATAIGQPTAVRAVARACASNPAALLVPCHRVIGCNGKLTGYRWGLDRKKHLLALESASLCAHVPSSRPHKR